MKALLLAKNEMDRFFERLSEGYKVYGPKEKDVCFTFDEIGSVAELRLDYISTLLPPKKFFHPPYEDLFSFDTGEGFEAQETRKGERMLLLGVHSCDVNGILRLDNFFTAHFKDPYYLSRRGSAVIVALNCTKVGNNCFCDSYGTGPSLKEGYDLLLTDLWDRYLLEVGSDVGLEIVQPLGLKEAGDGDFAEKERRLNAVKGRFEKFVDTRGLTELAGKSFDHGVWADLSDICLSCGACSLVCPTCYCYNIIDKLELSLKGGKRMRQLDSCQLLEYAEVVLGINFRRDRSSRIRHWMLCKLSYFDQQTGLSGCVGCGRCIEACPVNIDITEVARRIRGG